MEAITLNQQQLLEIDPYTESGNVIYPSFQLPLQAGAIVGIYTDVTKINTLTQWFTNRDNTYTHVRESALYERLTVSEYIQFSMKLLQLLFKIKRIY